MEYKIKTNPNKSFSKHTTMNRAEAIKIIRETYHTEEELNALETLIPELKESEESEEERVRKDIIGLIKFALNNGSAVSPGSHTTKEEAISWLEKQKEQKPAEWSEEDVDMLNSCISSIEEAKENRYAYKETDGDTSYDHEIAWLKSLRPHWKPSNGQMEALRAAFTIGNLWNIPWAYSSLKELYEQLKQL